MVVGIPEATYHYNMHQLRKDEDADRELIDKTHELFKKHGGKLGYRRIHLEFKKEGYQLNHKKVQRIMREEGLKCVKFTRRSRRYQSYKGTVGFV